jgi:non-ribosomal peptide synthetase component F
MCAESRHDLVASFHYNTALFDAATITRMADHYLTLLKSVVASHAEMTMSGLPMISSAERDLVVHQFNDTKRDFPADKVVCSTLKFHVQACVTEFH